jgi:hypothetical protein
MSSRSTVQDYCRGEIELPRQQPSAANQQSSAATKQLHPKDAEVEFKSKWRGDRLRRRVSELEMNTKGRTGTQIVETDTAEEQELGEGDGPGTDAERDEEFLDPCPENIQIQFGMSGIDITIPLEADVPFEVFRARIHEVLDLPIEVGMVLSAAGVKIESREALMEHHVQGEVVHALMFKDLDRMSLEQIAEELALDYNEFKGHAFTLSKMPSGSSARFVADYLWSNQVLLTSQQAVILFDLLIPKLRAEGGGSLNARAELIVALHSFCVHQHHIWEPDDGMSACLWRHMRWSLGHLPLNKRRLTRGTMQFWIPLHKRRVHKRWVPFWEHVDAALLSSLDAWPVEDLCYLRGVARARRAGKEEPLQDMSFVFDLDAKNWRNFQ